MSRYLGSETAEADLACLLAALRDGKSDSVPQRVLETLEKLPAFLDVVEASYQKYEENIAIAERNITVSSEELVQASRSIKSMVNSLGQGFLMFDGTGICSQVYSKACETLLETVPAGKPISAVLRLDEEAKNRLDSLLRLIFSDSHAMSFDEIMRFAPKSFPHSGGAHIDISYKPDLTRGGKVDRVVVVATDITEQVRAKELADARKGFFEAIERISHDRQTFCSYMRRTSDCVKELGLSGQYMTLEVLLREIHTLKGGAGMFRLNSLVKKFHELETAFQPFPNRSATVLDAAGNAGFQTLLKHQKILQEEIDALAKSLNRLLGIDITRADDEAHFDKRRLYAFAQYLDSLGLAEVRDAYVERVCAESLIGYLKHFDVALGDLASLLNKKIRPIRFTGQDIPFIIAPYGGLFASFVHLFRNMVDHGIETPENRLERGKDEAGQIEIALSLRVLDSGNRWLRLEISDDGTGIDTSSLRAKLIAKKPNGKWGAASEQDILGALLTQNISARDEVSLYSGRGTGMGAVSAEVVKLGGNLTIETQAGRGTKYVIEVPYRLEVTEQ